MQTFNLTGELKDMPYSEYYLVMLYVINRTLVGMVFLCIVLKKYFVVLCPTKFLVGTFVSQREESVLQLLPASFTKSFLYLYPLLESMIWTMAGDDVTT